MVVIDDSRTMQAILRSILLSMKIHRVRVFDSVDQALPVMLADPPNLILSEWVLGPTNGQRLLNMLRARFMGPLCFVPVIFVTARVTAAIVDRAVAAGAHLILTKPVSPAALTSRIAWLKTDDREFVPGAHGRYEIDGISERLRNQQDRETALRRVSLQQGEPVPMQMPAVALPPPPAATDTGSGKARPAGTPRVECPIPSVRPREAAFRPSSLKAPGRALRSLSASADHGAARPQ